MHGLNHIMSCACSSWCHCVCLSLTVLLVIDAVVVAMDSLVRVTTYVSFVMHELHIYMI